MWPWRREPHPRSHSEAVAPAETPTGRGAWRTVPPIQRNVGEHPLVNPSERFAATLTTWRTPSFLEPLDHALGAAEPAGTIEGLAPTTPAAVPPMPPLRGGGHHGFDR